MGRKAPRKTHRVATPIKKRQPNVPIPQRLNQRRTPLTNLRPELPNPLPLKAPQPRTINPTRQKPHPSDPAERKRLVEEVAGAREVHGDAGLVGGFDGGFVSDGAAGLDYCFDAAFDEDL